MDAGPASRKVPAGRYAFLSRSKIVRRSRRDARLAIGNGENVSLPRQTGIAQNRSATAERRAHNPKQHMKRKEHEQPVNAQAASSHLAANTRPILQFVDG